MEQCTVDTDTTTGQSVPAVIGNYRKIQYTVCVFVFSMDGYYNMDC